MSAEPERGFVAVVIDAQVTTMTILHNVFLAARHTLMLPRGNHDVSMNTVYIAFFTSQPGSTFLRSMTSHQSSLASSPIPLGSPSPPS